jgi:hypothetical protein
MIFCPPSLASGGSPPTAKATIATTMNSTPVSGTSHSLLVFMGTS